MLEELKIMLGEAAGSYTDAQIGLALKQAIIEVEDYCGRELDAVLELAAQRIAVIKLNRMGTEGAVSQSFNGTSESYLDGLPADIIAILNRKRLIKVV